MEEIADNFECKISDEGAYSASNHSAVVTLSSKESYEYRKSSSVKNPTTFDLGQVWSTVKDSNNESKNKKSNSVVNKRRKKQASVIKRKRISCEVCGWEFRDNHNFRRHFETKHGTTFTCNLCSASFNTERKLQRHMKKHESSIEGSGVKCITCSRVFRDEHNLNAHSCSNLYKYSSCIFPNCDKKFYHITKMLKHVDEDHNDKIDIVNLTFESETLFQRWKEEEELKSYSHYSKRSGTVDSYYGSYRCFECQANGDHVTVPRKTSKRWKKGPVRLGKLCPSRMLVKEINGKIHVKYVRYHSHPRSVRNDKLPVPKSVKTYAKNLLLMGASPQQVRKNVCERSFGSNSIIPKGGYVISNRYFFDLKKRLDCHQLTTTDDKYDPVFIYKPEKQPVVVGDEALDKLPQSEKLFAIGLQTKEQCVMMKKRAHVIVCVTSANTYNLCGFEIFTLIVPDVFGNGYPVAYFLTSHVDEETLTLLFHCLKSRCSNVKIKCVMTENHSSLFTAMNNVFGNLKHYLCQTSVLNCWQNEIMKNCQSGDSDMMISLKTLLYEKNVESFKIMTNAFIEQYSDCRSEFITYFTSNFLTCPDIWAMCYRNSSSDVPNPCPYTNVTLYCEYVENQLKISIPNENAGTSSVADLALLILRIQDGHSLNYKNHLENGTRVRSAVKGKHFSGLEIVDSSVSSSSGKWMVKSRYDDSVMYTVSEETSVCKKDFCYERCSEATCQNLCNHLYKCSCDDKFSLCEHIHKVHSMVPKQKKNLASSRGSLTKTRQKKMSSIESKLNTTPRNTVMMIEIFPVAERNGIGCKTEIKHERDTVTDLDIEFVTINVSESSEEVEILERLYEGPKKDTVFGRVDEEMEDVSKEHEVDERLDLMNTHSNKGTSLQRKRQNVDKVVTSHTEITAQHSMGLGLSDSHTEKPSVKVEALDGDIRDTVNEETSHFHLMKREDENEFKLPCIELGRSKRSRSSSVVQSATENKRRRIEGSISDCKIEKEDSKYDWLIDSKCNFCKRVFRDNYNLERHIANNHSDNYHCSECGAVFKTKGRFENHIKKHGLKSSRSGSVQCPKCQRMFRDNYNMKKHCCDVAKKQSLCIYPECGKQFYHMKHMVRHLEEAHNNKVDCSDLYFDSEKLFFAWKEEEETRSIAVFNKRNGTLGSDNVRYSYYVCQAGGESIVSSVASKRRNNRVRIGKPCPSRMLVHEEDGKFRVKYISYHSHDVQEGYKSYPPLPKYVKELGKQLLLMGIPPKRVRERIQDGVLLNNSRVKQKSYAVRKSYFYDMKKRLEKKGLVPLNEIRDSNEQQNPKDFAMKKKVEKKGLVPRSEIRDSNEYWKPKDFGELISGGKPKCYNSLLIYKPRGHPAPDESEELVSLPFYDQLFALGFQTKDQNEIMKEEISKVLCVRSYFGATFDGFQLLNLVVPDKFGNGYPIAHFIVSHVNEITLTFLFQSLKKQCPNLEVRTLITDEDDCVHNAMQRVFGNIHHYVCQWHVKNCWQEKIEQLVVNEDHKMDIFFHLIDILYERDQSQFEILCRNFSDNYSSTCPDFIEYFIDIYLTKPEVWAMCYRQNLDVISFAEPFSDVNLHIEYLHNQLNSFNVGGKFSHRVAELTKLLLKVEREYGAMYRKDHSLVSPVYSSAIGRHFSGLKIEDKKVLNEIEDKSVQNDGNTWIVSSRFDRTMKYTVDALEKNCSRVNCFEKCSEFLCEGLCSHLYSCSCEDRADLCEHIHKVHSLNLRLSKPSDIETIAGDKASSIHLIVSDGLEEMSIESRMKIDTDSFAPADLSEDSIVYHEINEPLV